MTQRILTSKLIFIRNEHVILKLLSFQQNDNELTVPIINYRLVTQFIEIILIPKNLFYLTIKRFDIHQRVPTQIDRFKLLKSFAYRNFLFTKKPLKADVNSSDLILSVKHFLKLISFELSVLLITAEALRRLPCQ
ncbi:hypothetical protein VCHA50P415_10001 [Vibrio chagasii]|nr:hypothetical protein VCHA34P121_160091 [Vibrio chagasii]CAH6838477.1 hypothetical protein VCHA37O173_10001 [Vibrio chagasii]CAH6842140.1 hypothetical protein VCHA34P126_10001 [Vibrio chagasii]CAH6878178.1 hypothetical protein VCHA29O39_20001 [Vibrio chagasii]CAH6878995.1 hypothetical protein VCHA34P114_20701 [Vibrio chagasii]